MAELKDVFDGETHARYVPNSYKATYGVQQDEEEDEKVRDEAEIRAMRKKIEKKLQTDIFKHTSGKEPSSASKDKTWYDIKPAQMQMPLYRNLRANKTWIGMNWNATDRSAVTVFRMGTEGRVSIRQPTIRGHRYLAGFDLSPFQENLLLTAGDGHLRFWQIPEEGFEERKALDAQDCDFQLESLSKITHVQFHPYIDGVVIVGASDFEGHVVQFWDLEQRKVRLELTEFQSEISDVSVSPNCDRAIVATKDGQVHTIELHNQKILRSFQPLEHQKDTCVLWVDQRGQLGLVAGHTRGNQRSVSLYNVFSGELLATHDVQIGGASLGMEYDPNTGLLLLTSFGSTFVQILRIHPKKRSGVSQLEHLNQFQSLEDITGHVLLPKSVVDVREVEVLRSVKLTRSNIALVNWTVPRKRKEYFQDDLFPPAYPETPRMTPEDFFSGRFPEGRDAWESETVDMRPEDMEKLSEAPEEELSERQKKYQAFKVEQAKPKPVGVLGHKSGAEVREYFLKAQTKYSHKNRWDAQFIDGDEVDDDEWDD